MRENFREAHRGIRKLLNDPSGVLVTILVVNEVVNVSISSLITKSLVTEVSDLHWIWHVFGGVLITSPVIIILCEVTPKTAATQINQLMATVSVKPMTLIYQAMFPVRWIASKILQLFSSQASRGPAPVPSLKHMRLKEDDFLILLEEGQREGMIHQDEIDLIRNIFDLDDTPVSDVATPLSNLYTVSAQSKVSDLVSILQKKRHARIPVFGANKRDIIGILYTKDVILARLKETHAQQTANDLMREPLYVHESVHLKNVFRRLRENKIHMAVVQNSKNEAIGIVTLGDILEEIFEDLIEDQDIPVGDKSP